MGATKSVLKLKRKAETGFYIHHTSDEDYSSMVSTLFQTKVWIESVHRDYDKFAISTSESLRMINSKLHKILIKQLQPLIDHPLNSNDRNTLYAKTSENVKIYDIINPFFNLEICSYNINTKDVTRKDIVNALNLDNQQLAYISNYISNIQNGLNDLKKINYIPAIFNCKKIKNKWDITIQSEINNLPRFLYPELYDTLQHIFSYFIPLIIDVLASRDDYDNDKNYKYKESIINKLEYNFKVIVKAQMYELKEMDNNDSSFYEGSYHLEGGHTQNIGAVGVYYFDISDNIDGGQLNICKAARYGLNDGCKVNQDINIYNETCVVFNNKRCIHRVTTMTLNAGKKKKDGYNIGYRKLLSFFVLELNDERIKCSDEIMVNLPYKSMYILSLFNRKYVFNKLSNDVMILINNFVCGSKQYIEQKTDLARSIFAKQNTEIINNIRANPSD